MKITRIRRIVQIIVFIGMFIIPLLNLLEIYFIKGTFISMDIGSLGIADPVMIFQALLSSMSAAGVLLVSVVLPLLIVIFFGRIWCSWACPYTLILQLVEKLPFLRKHVLLNKTKLASTSTFRVHILRYTIFIGFLALVGVAGVPILHLFSPPAVISTQALLLVKTAALSIELLFIVAILVVDLRFSYRFTCRYLCPTGTCLSLFKNRYSLQVQYLGKCSDCGACEKACPMGLEPRVDGHDRLCYNCGECIAACHDEVKPLQWSFGEQTKLRGSDHWLL